MPFGTSVLWFDLVEATVFFLIIDNIFCNISSLKLRSHNKCVDDMSDIRNIVYLILRFLLDYLRTIAKFWSDCKSLNLINPFFNSIFT